MSHSDFSCTDTQFGFNWGPMIVERMFSDKRGVTVIIRTADSRRQVQVYMTAQGRRIRVWKPGRELK